MHTVSELVEHAGAVGLVTRRELDDGVVTVARADGEAHVRAICVQERPVGYVKESDDGSTDHGRRIDHERDALRSVAGADLGPRLLTEQPADALWVGVLRGRVLTELHATIPELAEICESWGVAVARLHQLSTTRPPVPEAPRPWLLDADARARAAHRAAPGSVHGQVIAAVEGEPALRAACRLLGSRWSDRHWIHGALQAPHVVVEATPPVRVRFANYEHAGLGDPTWDLATAVDTITGLAPRWRTPADPLVGYLLRGYRRAGGPATLHPAVQAVSSLAAAWQTGCPGARTAPGEVQRWLDRARGFACRAVLGA